GQIQKNQGANNYKAIHCQPPQVGQVAPLPEPPEASPCSIRRVGSVVTESKSALSFAGSSKGSSSMDF
ncbi:MAG: hypothetical protein EBU49_13685, partial [Proteobacteria bacterium]|nr:hypothetical protein [Pseudomonadota bacterium]